jgi:hypothetical protein
MIGTTGPITTFGAITIGGDSIGAGDLTTVEENSGAAMTGVTAGGFLASISASNLLVTKVMQPVLGSG